MAATIPVFRVTTYQLAPGDFAGTVYNLKLRWQLSTNYFVMLQWGQDTGSSTVASDLGVQVVADPYGTGDLAQTAGNWLKLQRSSSTKAKADLVVTVVECLADSAGKGFRLLDVAMTTLGTVGAPGVQTVNDTVAAWSDINQVVPFGGFKGGGAASAAAGSSDKQVVSYGVAIIPTGADTLQFQRNTPDVTWLVSTSVTTYVVEWGSDWTVERATVTGTNSGATLSLVGHYSTQALVTPATRASSWLWACSYTDKYEAGACGLSQVATLGDGVTQLASEGVVAVGCCQAVTTRNTEVYVLQCAGVATDWVFKTAAMGVGSMDLTVDAAGEVEDYLGSDILYPVCTRGRLAHIQTSVPSASTADLGEALLMVRPTGSTKVRATTLDPAPALQWVGWLESVEFAAVTAPSGTAVEVAADDALMPTPQAYLLLQDPHWAGSTNLIRVTSEGGLVAGPVQPDSDNLGSVVGFQEGTPVADSELDYRLREGAVGGSGGWLWRYTSETSADDWRAMNAPTQLWRQQSVDTASRWVAHDVAYSTAFRRVLLAQARSTTEVRVWYKDVDDFTLATWSHVSITTSGLVDPTTTSKNGLGLCEVPSGALLLVETHEGTGASLNFTTRVSLDGGGTWTRTGSMILSKVGLGGLTSCVGQHQLRSSGDWVRCAFLSSEVTPGYTSATMRTLVSPDQGSSWSLNSSSVTVLSWGGGSGGPSPSYPFAMVGLGDVSGTFLLARLKTGTTATVRFSMAARDDDWVDYSTLDWDLSGYATSAAVKALCFVRDQDRIWLYAWVEGTDASEIVVAVVDPSDPTNPANWTDMGVLTGFAGVLRYGPHALRGAFCGHRIVLSAGLYNESVAVGADPVVAGHWFLQSGGYDPKPWDYSLLDWDRADVFVSSPLVCSYQWSPCLSEPAGGGANSSAITPWTQTLVAGGTTTWNKDEVVCSAGAGADVARYDLPLGVPASGRDKWGAGTLDRGYSFQVRCQVDAQRVDPLVASDGGFSVQAMATAVAGYDFDVRVGTNRVVIYDNRAAAILTSQATTDFREVCELRILLGNGNVGLRWRKVSDGVLADWTELAPAALTIGAVVQQNFGAGVLTAVGVAGTTTFRWSGLEISRRSDLSQYTDVTKPTDLMGTRLNRGALYVANGVRVKWGGSGATDTDSFTGAIDHVRGQENLSLDSPRYYWESTTMVLQELVFRCDLLSTTARWQMNALLLVGTVDRTCLLQFSNTDSAPAWAAPAVEYELSADLFIDLTVVAVDGAAVQLQDAFGAAFEPRKGSLVNAFLRFTVAGGATGVTMVIKNQVADTGWVHLASGVAGTGAPDLAAMGVVVGATAVVFGDRMVYMGTAFRQYLYFRLVFPNVSGVGYSFGTATGTHRLGSMVPGFWKWFDVPLEWSATDNDQPNITEYRAKGGAGWQYQEGPAQRTLKAMVVGDVQESRRSLRDILRAFHGYSVRPVGLVLDSTHLCWDTVLFGRWDSGGQMDDAAWYQDSDGVWRQAGDGDMQFVEEV